MLPGLGMAVRPPQLDESFIDDVVHVEEADTIRTCHQMARRGFLFGGSTGTVVAAATRWLATHDETDTTGDTHDADGARKLTAVALSPDMGERYLETIYQTNWVADLYGDDVLDSNELTTDELTTDELAISSQAA